MLKNSIRGFEGLITGECDIPRNSVILVTGVEGSLKSGFVFNMISNYLSAGAGEYGLYATLEETSESHLRNMESLGIKKADELHVFDYRDIRHEWETEEPDMVRVTEDMIDFYREKYKNLTVFALDSLNALYSVSSPTNLRKNMYRFFTMLRDKEMTSLLIMETCSFEKHFLLCLNEYIERPEYFLADGIIELGMIETKENVKRYIQIRKMRAVNHLMEKRQIVVEKGGIRILGSVY